MTGSAGGGPPDGYVDFEDLMIFAMAYGSTPSDTNWNEACDIASLGSLVPDGIIDFEDLMIFAMNYGLCEEPCPPPSAPTLSDPGSSVDLGTPYDVCWSAVTEATSYVLQEATSSDFTSGLQEFPLTDISKDFSHTVTTSTTYYYRVAAVNSHGQSGWSNVEDIDIVTTYNVGDIGPAGGLIFYDKGSVSDGWRYLEAALSDQSIGSYWGCEGTSISVADGTAVGTGEQNTIAIEAGCATEGTAADICANLSLGGYDDWFLPSRYELYELYLNRVVIGGFVTDYYWSSSEYDAFYACCQNFTTGANNVVDYKDAGHYVRAVRAF